MAAASRADVYPGAPYILNSFGATAPLLPVGPEGGTGGGGGSSSCVDADRGIDTEVDTVLLQEALEDVLRRGTDVDRTHRMAQEYRVCGAPVSELCAHNARVAAAAEAEQLAHTWQALHFVLEAATGVYSVPGIFCAGDGSRLEGGADGCRSSEHTEQVALPHLVVTPSIARSDQPEAPMPAVAPPAKAPDASLIMPEGSTAGLGTCTSAAVSSSQAEDEELSSREALLSSIIPVVRMLMAHHAERGDTQTCVVLARTLQPVAPRLAPQKLIRRWTLAYIERLKRLQLFGIAADVIKQSYDEQVQNISQRSTTVGVGGGGASASRNVPPRAVCSVCQLAVRGLHVWCQGCGHGGHVDHMREWFRTSLECPTGCGHQCQLKPVTMRSPLRSTHPAAKLQPPYSPSPDGGSNACQLVSSPLCDNVLVCSPCIAETSV